MIMIVSTRKSSHKYMDKIKLFREIMDKTNHKYVIGKKFPLIIGAGLDSNNVLEQLPLADGAIVGSTFKPNKFTHSMIDRVLVREFMNKVKEVRKK